MELLARMEGMRGLSVPLKRGYEAGGEGDVEGERKVRRVDETMRKWAAEEPRTAREASTGVRDTPPLLNGVVMTQYGETRAQRQAPAQEAAPPATEQDVPAPTGAVVINKIELARPADPLGQYYTEAQMRGGSGLFVTPARSPSPDPLMPNIPDGKDPAQSSTSLPLERLLALLA